MNVLQVNANNFKELKKYFTSTYEKVKEKRG